MDHLIVTFDSIIPVSVYDDQRLFLFNCVTLGVLLNSSLFVLFGGNSGGVQQDFFIIDVDDWNVTNSFAGANVNGNASNGEGASGSSGISGGAIAGIVVGVVVGVR